MEKLNERSALADVYMQACSLPPSLYPGHLVRDETSTLIFFDPRASRVEMALWTADHLTTAEANAVRKAYGQPARGKGVLSDDLLDGQVATLVPEALRLPGPIQHPKLVILPSQVSAAG